MQTKHKKRDTAYLRFCERMLTHSEFASCLRTFGKIVEKQGANESDLRFYVSIINSAKSELQTTTQNFKQPPEVHIELLNDIKVNSRAYFGDNAMVEELFKRVEI